MQTYSTKNIADKYEYEVCIEGLCSLRQNWYQ